MDFVSSWDLQDRFSHILEAGRANLLDGFAISRTYSTEYIRGSLRIFPMHWSMDIGRERFRETVSDHLPFIASFRIDRDRETSGQTIRDTSELACIFFVSQKGVPMERDPKKNFPCLGITKTSGTNCRPAIL